MYFPIVLHKINEIKAAWSVLLDARYVTHGQMWIWGKLMSIEKRDANGCSTMFNCSRRLCWCRTIRPVDVRAANPEQLSFLLSVLVCLVHRWTVQELSLIAARLLCKVGASGLVCACGHASACGHACACGHTCACEHVSTCGHTCLWARMCLWAHSSSNWPQLLMPYF